MTVNVSLTDARAAAICVRDEADRQAEWAKTSARLNDDPERTRRMVTWVLHLRGIAHRLATVRP